MSPPLDKEKAIRAYEQMRLNRRLQEQLHLVNLTDGEDAANELIEQRFLGKNRPQGEKPMSPRYEAPYEAAMEIREALICIDQTLQRIAAAVEWANHESHPHRHNDDRSPIPIKGCAICAKSE